jgi:hypothetical protein
MLTSAKINLKTYSLYSAILLILAYLSVRSEAEFLVAVVVFLATCANHWMLIFIVRRLSESAVGMMQKSRLLIPLMVVGKLILIVAALSFGVQIMGKRIIIPVLIYVLQIAVLYFSFEKQTDVGKGI